MCRFSRSSQIMFWLLPVTSNVFESVLILILMTLIVLTNCASKTHRNYTQTHQASEHLKGCHPKYKMSDFSRKIEINCQDVISLVDCSDSIKTGKISGDYEEVMVLQYCPVLNQIIKELLSPISIQEVIGKLHIYYANNSNDVSYEMYFDEESFHGLSNNVTGLYLRENRLKRIPLNFFNSVPRVTVVDLASNDLESLENGTFECLVRLQTLNLRKNRLSNSTQETLAPLHDLIKLDLSDNKLTTLSANTFQNLTQLQDLNLSFNDISALPEGILNDLKSLKIFRADGLYRKKQVTIPSNLFQGPKSLQQIYMNENNLNHLPENIFYELSELQNVSLRANGLTELPRTLFNSSTALMKIDLSDNKLKSVDDILFRGLDKLEELHLEKNELTFIHP